jgi:hypothetical protein
MTRPEKFQSQQNAQTNPDLIKFKHRGQELTAWEVEPDSEVKFFLENSVLFRKQF